MNSKDLRIGNACIERYSKEIIFVTALKSVHEGVEVIEFTGDFAGKWQAEYIPITEQWLLNLGFDSEQLTVTGVMAYKKGLVSVVIFNNDVKGVHVGMISVALQRIDDGSKINKVHQLQNLYFALTNTELILKSIS